MLISGGGQSQLVQLSPNTHIARICDNAVENPKTLDPQAYSSASGQGEHHPGACCQSVWTVQSQAP